MGVAGSNCLTLVNTGLLVVVVLLVLLLTEQSSTEQPHMRMFTTPTAPHHTTSTSNARDRLQTSSEHVGTVPTQVESALHPLQTALLVTAANRTSSAVPDTPLVTFIIPTKGRDTLNRTLSSLRAQTKPHWRAVVVCDGVDVPVEADVRMTLAKIPQTGAHNHAGQLRNFGMLTSDTEWVAFVDDDDTLAPTYVQHLEDELALTTSLECCIFRMLHNTGIVLPPPADTNFASGKVGISFALQRRLYLEGFMFVPGQFEDFRMLDSLRQNKKKMVISRHTAYFVRAPPAPDTFFNTTVRGTIN